MNLPAENPLFDRIDAALPQTQCTRCGYQDCAAYAQAVASGEAPINQCPPGGAQGIERLSRITRLPVQPLNPINGIEAPRGVAIIDEAWCIGCTLCIAACPTDAIFGSNKVMHTVIEAYCTGCELCIPVCPVDCISLENTTGSRTGWSAWSDQEAETARKRYQYHRHRRVAVKAYAAAKAPEKPDTPDMPSQRANAQAAEIPESAKPENAMADDRKRKTIAAVLARARAQRETKR